jgi:hypothetical protein
MLSDWNKFVQKIYKEGKAKDPDYKPKQAFKDASRRKSEMKHTSSTDSSVKKTKSSRSRKGGRRRKGGKTRKNRH